MNILFLIRSSTYDITNSNHYKIVKIIVMMFCTNQYRSFAFVTNVGKYTGVLYVQNALSSLKLTLY